MSAKQWSALGLTATAFVVASLITSAQAQVLPRNRAPAQSGAQPAAPAPGETAGQARRDGRENARDARADARAAGETGPQARATARETRQETRQNVRGADYGLTFNNAANNGLVVSNIAANSAFATAGLRAGDQLVSFNGQPITNQQQFYQYLSGPNLGTRPAQFIVLRNGQQVPLTIQPQALAQYQVPVNDPLHQYGLLLDNQNPNQVVVQQVYPNTPAYTAGIRQGDIITGLGGQPINGVNAFTQGLTQATGNIPLAITRAGQTQNLQLQALNAQDSSARTALRPNFDGAAGANANANVGPNGANANVGPTGANANIGPAGVNANAGPANAGANANASAQGNANLNTPAANANTQGGANINAPSNAPGSNPANNNPPSGNATPAPAGTPVP